MAISALAAAVRPAAPVRAPQPGPHHGAAIARAELGQARDAERPASRHDQQVESLAALTLAGQPGDVGGRLLDRPVGTPGEELRDLGIRAQLEQRRGVGRGGVPQGQRRAGQSHRGDAIDERRVTARG